MVRIVREIVCEIVSEIVSEIVCKLVGKFACPDAGLSAQPAASFAQWLEFELGILEFSGRRELRTAGTDQRAASARPGWAGQAANQL